MSESTPEDHTLETSAATDPVLPDTLDALLALGQQCLDDGNYSTAQRVFNRALELEPANVVARHNLGYAFECQGVIDDAIVAYEAAGQGPAPLAQSSFNLGVLLARSGRNDEARQAFQQALERDPTCAKAWINLGVLHARTGQLEEARRCYGQALEADPSCHSAHLKLANLLARQNRWEEALGAYAQLVEDGWNLAEVQYRRGLALAAQGDEAGAIDAYERALAADPEHVFAQVQLALMQAQHERYDQATATLQRAAEMAPDDARVHYNLGNMHGRQAVDGGELRNYGYADAALRAYRRAIDLDPQLFKAYYNLACVAEKINVQEGITAWEQYLAVTRDVPSEQEWVMKARRYWRALKGD